MKRSLLFILLIISGLALQAQPFGNEWIDYSREHYKIKIAQDGFYRIPFTTLQTYIPNAGSLNPQNLVLFHNGEKVPIYISTTANQFGANDYVEFYGKKNVGDVDSMLYRSTNQQPHPYYSLFTDTAIYYLTTVNQTNNPRFAEVNNNLSSVTVPKEDYFYHTERTVLSTYVNSNSFMPGKYYSVGSDETYKSAFEQGEGFTGNVFFGSTASASPPQQVNQAFTISTPSVYTGGPSSFFRTAYVNNSNEFHDVRLLLNGNLLYSQNAFGFQLNKAVQTLASTNLQSSNTLVYSAVDLSQSKRQNSVSYFEMEYPRLYNFGGQSSFYFKLQGTGSNQYIEVSNFNDNGTAPVLYDLTNALYYKSVQVPGSNPVKYHVVGYNGIREMLLRADDTSTVKIVSALFPVSFTNYGLQANQGDYLIISNRKLFDDGNGNNPVEEYRTYRNNTYTARTFDIEQLYDQFAYGVNKSPLAIRNFIQYALNNWTVKKPRFVFLIGKGREYPDMRASNATANRNQCLVPTFGYPGSDNLLATTRGNDLMTVSIGRLAAENTTQIKDYLDKVKTYEAEQNTYAQTQAIAPKIWQKHVLHFSGGTGLTEQNNFRNYLASYKTIIEDTLWGTRVSTYSKTDNNPVSQTLSQLIRGQIEEGASLITFFGHSATGAFDFSIDEPENYTNKDKYPVILSNGCFAGFIHDAGLGYSERFVYAPEAGAIAFIATTSLSVSSGLNKYSGVFYRNFSDLQYRTQIGLNMRQTLQDVVLDTNSTDFDEMVAFEMTLHGDPGLYFNQYPKPDYAIDGSSVFFNPATVTPGTDSFEVNVVVTNLGKAIDDSIAVTLRRTIFDANNNPVVYNMRLNAVAPYYRDTVTFKLPVNISNLGYGQNLFEPYVDADFEIDEMAEQNNGVLAPVSIYIQNDDIIPVYPYEFAIVPQQGVTLKASTINPFAAERNYKLEIDTSELFISPLQATTVFQGGGVVHWTPTLTYKDSTVYYWRVAKDSAGAQWHYSSFIYLANEYPGWNQSHYYQWKKDDFNPDLKLDNDRVFRFPAGTNEIRVVTGNGFANNPHFENLGWDYNNYNEYRWRMGNCGGGVGYTSGLTFAIIDSLTGAPFYSTNFDGNNYGDKFSNIHCSDKAYIQYGFDFPTTGTNANLSEPWHVTIRRFIDSIPSGAFVLMYSVNLVPFTSWDTALVTTLQNLGFAQASLFKGGGVNGPLMFFTQKGNLNYNPFVAYQQGYATPLDSSFTFIGKWNTGSFTSTRIGPALEWGSVHWSRKAFNNAATDKDSLDIIGVSLNGIDTVLISTSLDNNLLDGADTIRASEFPYLKLRLRTTDDSLRTPTQLQYWRVLYKKAPEAAINPSAWFKFIDSLSLGQSLHVEIGLESITEVDMDSMLTKYTVRDALFNTQNFYIRQNPLPGLDTMILVFDLPLGSSSYAGLNKLIIEANPEDDQLEQFHFNNIAEIDFTTSADNVNPLLDVTFDGQHIFNGDIVSGKPDVLITLKDENKFLALNDTSVLDVYLKFPNETTPRRMNYDDVIMKFYPADAANLNKNNRAQVELKPILNIDGTYELLVKDRDITGNNSSNLSRNDNNVYYDYKTSFEVINKPMVSNVLNYPNPFTTATKFVFTITGSEVPDFMKIQIMTIKGTVVKEIFKDEMGPLRVGRNITEYTWNGRDQYGDLLANGVYFYRVVTRLADKDMDHMGQSYDKYFKKGFGKLVIVR